MTTPLKTTTEVILGQDTTFALSRGRVSHLKVEDPGTRSSVGLSFVDDDQLRRLRDAIAWYLAEEVMAL